MYLSQKVLVESPRKKWKNNNDANESIEVRTGVLVMVEILQQVWLSPDNCKPDSLSIMTMTIFKDAFFVREYYLVDR